VRPPEDRGASTSRARTAEPIMTPVPPTTVIEMPRTIPTVLPQVDLSLPPVDPSECGSGSPAPRGGAGVESAPSSGGFGALTALQVDRAVIPLAGNRAPAYPSLLRAAGADGEAIAQLVVDTTGRVDMSTFRAVRATDEQFVESV